MTLSHNRYCYHNELDIHRVEDGSFMLKGWFPLHNKHWRNNHKCGEIEMEIQWRYVPGYDNNWEPPKMGAMSQIKMNSAETNLRMGDLMKVKWFLYSISYNCLYC